MSWNPMMSFTDFAAAHLAVEKLQSNGLNPVLKDQMTVQTYTGAFEMGTLKLFIHELEAKEAASILKSEGFLK
ncbi:MAG: hypothetical protein AAF502_06600 [Bacteroidota bacterium]